MTNEGKQATDVKRGKTGNGNQARETACIQVKIFAVFASDLLKTAHVCFD